jgi:tRNA A-37 threonylcarbamoyl transferase component Bud32
MTNLASGARVGSYELVSLIGQTHMSEVWRALDWQGNTVAVKTISTRAGEDPQLRARFLREGVEHKLLDHPGIVPILDFFEQDDNSYLVMRYLSGGSIEDRLEKQNWAPLSISDALQISACILPALDYAHQRLVIHRDVKPSNILLQGDRAYLSDFGIALALGRPRLTKYAQIIGTRCYMSPEQIQSPLSVTHLTDVFSFGCVLYEMLTGRQPHDYGDESEEGHYALLAKRIHEPPVPPSQWNPEINARLERIVLTSLAPDPEDRFPGCGSFARALEGMRQESDTKKLVVPSPLPAALEPPAVAPLIKTAPSEWLPPQPTAKTPVPQKISVAGNTLAAVASGVAWLPFAAAGADVLRPMVTLCVLVSYVLFLRMLFKAWAALPPNRARTTPGKAVGYLLIPLFALYWCWIAVAGLATDYNQYIAAVDEEKRTPLLSANLYKLFCLLYVYVPLLAAFLPVTNLAGFVILFNMALPVPVLILSMARAINGLSKLASQMPAAAGSLAGQGVR